jgi:hypothetical protein
MRRAIATTAVLALSAGLAACGGGKTARPPAASASPTPTAAPKVAITAADRPACRLLYARLQRVTTAIATSSELIAHSLNKQQLGHRIAVEQQQLERSARLMTGGPIPAPLVAADRELVAALHAFSRDFTRAMRPAARGDFRGAAAAMTDRPVVQRIVTASKTIEDACN